MLTFVLILIIVVLAAVLLFINQKNQKLQKELEQTRNQLETHETNAKQRNESQNKLWDTFNAVHLYASLTEEEVKMQSAKDKQKKIMAICETALKEYRY